MYLFFDILIIMMMVCCESIDLFCRVWQVIAGYSGYIGARHRWECLGRAAGINIFGQLGISRKRYMMMTNFVNVLSGGAKAHANYIIHRGSLMDAARFLRRNFRARSLSTTTTNKIK